MLTQKIKNIKHNKKTVYILLSLLFLFIIICFALNPKYYMQQTLNGLNVFLNNVFPALFPFFIFSKILTGLNCIGDFSMHFGKFTKKAYNTPGISAYVLFMALISGYPVGAKVTSELYKQNQITKSEVNRIITFTSTSGPLFVIGTVGVSLLNSYKCGVIMLFCHIVASLLNGILYRKKDISDVCSFATYRNNFTSPNINEVISESVYNSVISISLVGAYIVVFFVIIGMINSLNMFNLICNLFDMFGIDRNITNSLLNGFIELTRGCIDIAGLDISIKLKTILCGGLISFGGFSVAFQGFAFLKDCNVKFSFYIKQKISHFVISLLLLFLCSFLI